MSPSAPGFTPSTFFSPNFPGPQNTRKRIMHTWKIDFRPPTFIFGAYNVKLCCSWSLVLLGYIIICFRLLLNGVRPRCPSSRTSMQSVKQWSTSRSTWSSMHHMSTSPWLPSSPGFIFYHILSFYRALARLDSGLVYLNSTMLYFFLSFNRSKWRRSWGKTR